MTALYRRALAFSKNLGRANGLVIAASLYGNAKDVVNTCNVNGWFEEKCNRSIVNNTVAGGTNVLSGVLIGIQQGDTFIAELDSGITITWTPDGTGEFLTPNTVLPEHDQLDVDNILIRPIEEHEQEIKTALYPTEDLVEYLITFPIDSGIPPLYIMYSQRDKSGVVTGKGKDVEWSDGCWLGEDANRGDGQYIPTKIADALRGREFNNFDEFRKAFWKEVAKDPELLSQFDKINQKQITKGNSPFSLPKYHHGKKQRYEIHHIKEIQNGGKVYDVNNLRINTPRNHIGIHSK